MKLKLVFEDLIKEEKNSEEYRNYKRLKLEEAKQNLTAEDRVFLARYKNRPKAMDFIKNIIESPLFFHGDRKYADDKAIVGGVGMLGDIPVTFLGIEKGRGLEESLAANFGMPHPEGYRKVQRLARQAEKFNRPIICFVDTQGAYPGVEAEERGQAEAIASTIYEMCGLKTNIISVIIGEGSSGGALALSVCDHLIMMENSIYSILSPEGFASILWKDSLRASEAMKVMKLTSEDLLKFKVCDEIVEEDLAVELEDFEENYNRLKKSLKKNLEILGDVPMDKLLQDRKGKYRNLAWD